MLATDTPRRLWDNWLELEAYIHSHSVNSIYRLDGEVSKTYLFGETANISQFCELAWYNRVMYRPGTIDYPNEPLRLGKYLGPAIDVGPAMTAKILQHNCKAAYWSLTVEGCANALGKLLKSS